MKANETGQKPYRRAGTRPRPIRRGQIRMRNLMTAWQPAASFRRRVIYDLIKERDRNAEIKLPGCETLLKSMASSTSVKDLCNKTQQKRSSVNDTYP